MEKVNRSPGDFLKLIKGRPVGVKLNDGSEYRGTFICLDGHLNVVLEKCEEIRDNRTAGSYGDIFIRGNNVSYIYPLPIQKAAEWLLTKDGYDNIIWSLINEN